MAEVGCFFSEAMWRWRKMLIYRASPNAMSFFLLSPLLKKSSRDIRLRASVQNSVRVWQWRSTCARTCVRTSVRQDKSSERMGTSPAVHAVQRRLHVLLLAPSELQVGSLVRLDCAKCCATCDGNLNQTIPCWIRDGTSLTVLLPVGTWVKGCGSSLWYYLSTK